MTMPGVDYYAAMILLSEIGDVKRFVSPEKLVSWVGLAPQVHQSGETQWTGRITRKGSKRARRILTQCAHTARQHDPKMREFYERIERKRKLRKLEGIATDLLPAIFDVLPTVMLCDNLEKNPRSSILGVCDKSHCRASQQCEHRCHS